MTSPQANEVWACYQEIAPESYFDGLSARHQLRMRKRVYGLATVIGLMIWQRLQGDASLAWAVLALPAKWQSDFPRHGSLLPSAAKSAHTGGPTSERRCVRAVTQARPVETQPVFVGKSGQYESRRRKSGQYETKVGTVHSNTHFYGLKTMYRVYCPDFPPDFPHLGIANIRGTSRLNIDAGVTRTFKIVETHSLQFRWEIFNLPNLVNFDNPTTALNSPNFGRILGAGDPRIMQAALKYQF